MTASSATVLELEPSACRAEWSGHDFFAPIPAGWRLQSGEALTDRAVSARLTGPESAPVIAALGGISATRFVCEDETHSGWWRAIARAGGALDTDKFRVLSMDFAPLDAACCVDIAPEDHARLLALAMDAAGVERLHAFLGASYGGMVALAFSRLYPERVGALIVLCAAHRPHPMATALRGVQRRIIEFGLAHDAPEDGVSLARQLAMTTYRSTEEFGARFEAGLSGPRSQACDYIVARAENFARAMSAERYLSLSAAIDRHDEDPSAITTPTLVISFESDQLVPVSDVEALVETLAGPAQLHVIDAVTGHDAFLAEPHLIDALLRARLQELSS